MSKKFTKIFLFFFMTGLPLMADQVTMRFSEGICGDCCIAKSMVKGVRDLKGVQIGKREVIFEFDPDVTNPEKIVSDLKKNGKTAEIISAVTSSAPAATASSSPQKGWVKPVANH